MLPLDASAPYAAAKIGRIVAMRRGATDHPLCERLGPASPNHPTTPGVVAEIFDATGALVKGEFNVTDASWDTAPQVTAFAGGGFAVAFQDRGSITLRSV